MKEDKLKEVYELLGRQTLWQTERFMFDNFWDKKEYEFRKCDRGRLSVHKI